MDWDPWDDVSKETFDVFNIPKHWHLFITKHINITCPTEKLEKEFLQYLQENGFTWNSGKVFINQNGELTIPQGNKKCFLVYSKKEYKNILNSSIRSSDVPVIIFRGF